MPVLLSGLKLEETSYKGIRSFYLLLFLAGWFAGWLFICRNQFKIDALLPFGCGLNPPGVPLMLFALFTAGICACAVPMMEKSRYPVMNQVVIILAFIGKHSLYVFLYHRLFLDFFLVPYLHGLNIWAKRVIYFSVILGMPILTQIIFQKLNSLKQKVFQIRN